MINDIELDPQNAQVTYAAEVSSGVYRSGDGGKTWQAIAKGMDVRSVNALALSSDGQHLYAATEGMGVFRLDLNGQPPASAPASTPTSAPTSRPAPTATAQSVAPAPTLTSLPTPTATAQSVSPAPTPASTPTSHPAPTATAQSVAPAPTPTARPAGGGRLCGGAAVLPLALLGLIWLRRWGR